MKKMTKWSLPLSLLMMVGVSSGAIDASAKTVNNDATKQTSVSNNNWQYNKAYNWVKVNNNVNSPFQVKKMTKSELDKYLASLKGSNKGTTTNKDSNKGTTQKTESNKGTTTNKDSNKGTTQKTESNKETTVNKDSNKKTTQNTESNKETTTSTDSKKETTQNTGSDKKTTTTTASNNGSTSNTEKSSATTNTGSNNSTSANSNSSSISQFEQQVITLTNAERAKEGLPALQADTTLMQSARAKSDDMAKNNYFSHTSPTYGSPFDQMKSFGISYKAAAENIAQGQKTPQEVVEAWMNSSGHRANIMNSSYTHIGVGYSSNGNYWTQQFIQK